MTILRLKVACNETTCGKCEYLNSHALTCNLFDSMYVGPLSVRLKICRSIEKKSWRLNCNKWTCGRCEVLLYPGMCALFKKAPIKKAPTKNCKHEYCRLPECLRADTEKLPVCAECGKRIDGRYAELCATCWRKLSKGDDK
jgi:hypothetical protein